MAPDQADQPPCPTPPAGGGYDSPRDGLKRVSEWYGSWSQRLSDTSVQLCYALVGANWAVFGSVDKLLGNDAARLSLVLALAFFALNLVLTSTVTQLLYRRYCAAEKDPVAWAGAFERTRGKVDPWPSTHAIDDLGKVLRLVRTVVPLASGLAFLFALFR